MAKKESWHSLKDWTLFEKIWLIVFTAITIYLFFAWGDTWLGLIASITGMLSVVLTAKGKISNYYIGIPNILIYSYIAYQNQYYGEVQLNMLYFLPMSIYGIFAWKKHVNKKKTSDDVLIKYLSWKEKAFWTIITITAIIIHAHFLISIRSGLPIIDAAANILSILAMIFMVKRVVEQWYCWILVDILTIWIWLVAFLHDGNDVTILIMWIAYLFNAFYGLYKWYNLEREQRG